jgi:hypothetical protein
MLKSLLHNYAFNLTYAQMLVGEIPDEEMAGQPEGIVNHPAWTLGHLGYASDYAAILLGLEGTTPQPWVELFGRGTTPVDDRTKYPPKEEMLAALEQQHARVADAISKADPALFEQPTANEEFRQIMPTVGDGLAYLLVSHEATHLGQVSAWRRAMGKPSVLG